MQSGILVDEAVQVEFTALRMKRTHRFLIFKVTDDKTKIELEHIGARDATFNDFKELMPKDHGR